MRFKRKRNTDIMEGDLTPMIDMTFQLIAFFMIIMNFSKVDQAEEIMLPTSRIAKPPEVIPDYKITINLFANEDGQDVVKITGQEYRTAALNGVLQREISAASRNEVAVEKIAVIIRGHEDAPTGMVQDLIAKCQSMDLEDFILRVKEDK